VRLLAASTALLHRQRTALPAKEARFHNITVKTCCGFEEATDWLASPERDVEAIVLDLMMPLSREAFGEYVKLQGKPPQGDTDAMCAGLVLLKRIKSSVPRIPVFILTNMPLGTTLGRAVTASVREAQRDGTIEGMWSKPANESFFEALEALDARREEKRR